MSYEWLGPTISALGGLAGTYFANEAAEDSKKDELKFQKEEAIRQLELEKLAYMYGLKGQQGGGGGGKTAQDRQLDALAIAMELEGNYANNMSRAYQNWGTGQQRAYYSTQK